MRPTEFRRPFLTTTLDDLTAEIVKSSGGRIFVDTKEDRNLQDIHFLIEAWRGVHAPTYGALIPNTSEIRTKVGTGGDGAIFTPSPNVSYEWGACSITNAGGAAPIEIEISLTDGASYVVIETVAIAPSTTTSLAGANLPNFDSTVYPYFRVISGTAGDANIGIAIGKIVQ